MDAMSQDIKIFTEDEIRSITSNYSTLIGKGGFGEVYRGFLDADYKGTLEDNTARSYKGTLEDNTAVVVSKFLYHADSEEELINEAIILSQIVHKNMIKLLGGCLEAETLILIYEYTTRGSLLDILGNQEHFPLDKRMRIAIKTAEALQYLHSPETGIIGHGRVTASTIFLDDNFLPKLTDFSQACKLIKESAVTDSLVSRELLEKVFYDDPSRYTSALMNLERDVYSFGVLFAIISRENNISLDDLIAEFTKAYQTDNSGKAFFDKDITAQEDITVLEDIGRLALKCTISDADEMVLRPTMKEAAEELHMIRKSWKEHTTMVPSTQATEIEARAAISAERKLPNLMRHLFGYRQIQR